MLFHQRRKINISWFESKGKTYGVKHQFSPSVKKNYIHICLIPESLAGNKKLLVDQKQKRIKDNNWMSGTPPQTSIIFLFYLGRETDVEYFRKKNWEQQ